MTSRKLEIKYVPIDAVKPWDKNPKKHNKKAIVESLKRFKPTQPILVQKGTGLIIAGHGRLEAFKELGYEEIPITELEMSDAEARAYALVDNQTVIAGGWDDDLLLSNLQELKLELPELDMTTFGFSDKQSGKKGEEDDFDVDAAIDDDVEPITKPGDLWILGRHRLLCGDATKKEDVERLMDGKKADMVFTDPPYNIASDSKNVAADCSRSMYKLSKSEWDKNFDINELFPCLFDAMAEDCTVYICTSHFLAGDIWKWMKEWANHYSYCVWSKPNPMPSLMKRHWTWNTELICYATRGKHIFHFPKEGHALSTWTINKKNGGTVHPTEKPVEVPSKAISFSSNEHQCVLDLFGGSGSTLIACEQLNRTCYMMEIDPKYCDVTVQRWENLTGQKAALVE